MVYVIILIVCMFVGGGVIVLGGKSAIASGD